MKRLHFTCELLSDVILNQRAATSGNQQTLDFIPGNNFLGIVAGQLYKSEKLSVDDKRRLFHAGEVRYGDAHPVLDGVRTLRVPAAMFYPKGEKVSDRCFIHHGYDRAKDPDKLQLKQCRSGFYAFVDGQAKQIRIDTSFAIKSAYDSAKRRSEDERMYGYESLPKGLKMAFDVEVDDSAAHLAEAITNALIGRRHVGRSRTAQYGLVSIEVSNESTPDYTRPTQGELTTVYADGRLIFFDPETGEPTFRPSVTQLGLTGGETVWEKCQVRTFQYAPWNGKRMTRDADRCGIEKGSVFVVRNAQGVPTESKYVGNFQNEGFGKVIYNPDFLDFDSDHNGLSTITFANEKGSETKNQVTLLEDSSPLLRYVASRKQTRNQYSRVYDLVDGFIRSYAGLFKDERFASQWGHIREIAMTSRDANDLKDKLYLGEEAYLSHGTAKEKWEERGRLRVLKLFIENTIPQDLLRLTIINLAAEMAKKCKK